MNLVETVEKTFAVNSIGTPLGSCTDDFLLNKAIEVLKNSDISDVEKNELEQLFRQNMYKSFGMFSNGKHAGIRYANVVKRYFDILED